MILIVVGVITLAVVGYFAYNKFVVEPKELDAADQMFVAQQNFQKATDDATKSDSLYFRSLE